MQRAQAIVDYIVLIVAITGAFFSMEVFMRRAIQAHIKDTLVAMNMANQVDDSNKVSLAFIKTKSTSKLIANSNNITVNEHDESITISVY